jgi:hypothetical protein
LARGEDDEQILVEEEGIIVYDTFIYNEIVFLYDGTYSGTSARYQITEGSESFIFNLN